MDAAHIYPYLGIKTNDVRNGIAMRVDVHRLFDGHLLSLEPENGGVVVRVASDLSGSLYEKLAGRSIRIPPNKSEHPAVECLRKHLSTFRAKTEER
ncbi:HNH endonuclease [Salinarimonas rosea]|uniref:HNH endonuclease n=1 Tax=Salinarimonas rosea TaxID=552063 RepID=UPI003CC91615